MWWMLPIGLVLIICAVLLVVYAFSPARPGVKTLTTTLEHGFSVGDTVYLVGEGLVVVTEVTGRHSFAFERQHSTR